MFERLPHSMYLVVLQLTFNSFFSRILEIKKTRLFIGVYTDLIQIIQWIMIDFYLQLYELNYLLCWLIPLVEKFGHCWVVQLERINKYFLYLYILSWTVIHWKRWIFLVLNFSIHKVKIPNCSAAYIILNINQYLYIALTPGLVPDLSCSPFANYL